MTFDTCQGEERDWVIYSMVATREDDKLGYVFIKDLESIDVTEENKQKAQRLNVGFSRAKEKMVFFLSKKVEEYDGSIGQALRHYKRILTESKELPSSEDTDQKSPMEAKVLGWIQKTVFFQANQKNLELKTQFPVGEYLKQLDPTYRHPKYVCDFLVILKRPSGSTENIIIEYDGFKEHFVNLSEVNSLNYTHYYSEGDVYREKVLEGYGYHFIRVNKFNVGKNPVEELNKRLTSLANTLLEEKSETFIDNIRSIVSKVQSGDFKECRKCGKLKDLKEFYDVKLVSGYGFYCNTCKSASPKKSKRKRNSKISEKYIALEKKESENCPKCSSKMKIRNGKYGHFWGCTRFPYCKGTRDVECEFLEDRKKKVDSLNGSIPFNQTDEYWESRYSECVEFYTENGKWPSGKSSDVEERSLYNWMKQQKRRLERGTLSLDQKKRLRVQISFYKDNQMVVWYQNREMVTFKK